MKKLLLLIVFSLFLLTTGNARAQSCAGTMTCCAVPTQTVCRDCDGDGAGDDDGFGNCTCGSEVICPGEDTYPFDCGSTNWCQVGVPSNCDFGGNCYPTGSCSNPSDNFCGDCINGCRANTKTCAQWIAEECSGAPTPPPGDCTTVCSYCRCGQSNGCLGTCGTQDTVAQTEGPEYTIIANGQTSTTYDSTEGRYFFRTDDDGKITVSWQTPAANSDLVEYRFVPSDSSGNPTNDASGNSGCDHAYSKCNTVSPSSTSVTFRPRTSRYYRMRIRQRTCCGNWSGWNEYVFRIDGQVGGIVFQDADNTAYVGSDNLCYDSNATTYLGTNPTLTSTGGGYSNSDTTLGFIKDYQTYLPYQNPGNVVVSATNLPAGYVCSCPQGCSYQSSAGVDAPNLTSGTGGVKKNVNFFMRTCDSTCSPLCGQVNGCGTTCGNSDAAIPGAPTLLSPTANQNINVDGATTVQLTFTRGSAAESTYVNIYPSDASASEIALCPGGTYPGRACATTFGTSYNFTFDPNIAQYTVRLTSINTTCNPSGTWGATSTAVTFNLRHTVSGTVRPDTDGSASLVGNNCIDLGFTPGSNDGGSTVLASNPNGSGGSFVGSDGTFSAQAPISTSGTTVTLNENAGYICTCPSGCSYGGVSLPSTNRNFYVSQTSGPWFAVVGGSIMALGESGTVIGSPIAEACTSPGCNPYLLRQNLIGTVGSSGYLVTGGGGVDVSATAGTQTNTIDQDLRNIYAQNTISVPSETFAHFSKLYKFATTPSDDFDGLAGRPSNTAATVPTHTPVNSGITAYYSANPLTIDTPWNVAAGETKVIFVNGNVQINARITVANGGFLAIISSGNISFGTTLGEASAASTTTNAEGVFIADGFLSVPSVGGTGDLKFVGAGTFVGWQDVQLDRDYDDGGTGALLNNANPTELFLYRPDFVLNAPTEMKTPIYEWSEVEP